MAQKLHEKYKVIDVDTHISEPYDLWTSRVSSKWGELVPHVVRVSKEMATQVTDSPIQLLEGDDVWVLGGEPGFAAAGAAMAGWKDFPPSHPPTIEEAHRASWDPKARIKLMDDYGLWANVLYPNVGGFGAGTFLKLKEPELMLECVRAYNDFQNDFCSVAPDRLIALSAMPFWDVPAMVEEAKRCAKNGHKGLLFTHLPESFGMPYLPDPHWKPFFETAQELGLAINFHIGNGNFALDPRYKSYPGNGRQANYVKFTTNLFLDNALGLEEVIVSGLCDRYPKLNFVSVESGVGWIPFLLASLDWQWVNSGVPQEHPEYKLLPSEYFKRQCYGCFWFENESAEAAMKIVGPDNFLFETDFPHPTSVAPGPNSTAKNPKEHMEDRMAHWPEEWQRKALHDNAAKLYHL